MQNACPRIFYIGYYVGENYVVQERRKNMDKTKMMNKIEMFNLESTMLLGASKAIMNKYGEIDEMPKELKDLMEYMDVLFKYCERSVDLTVASLKMQVETTEMIEEIKNELEELKKGANEYVKADNKCQNYLRSVVTSTDKNVEVALREIIDLKQKRTETKN